MVSHYFRLIKGEMWKAVALMPKGIVDFREIGITGVIRKTVSAILENLLGKDIEYHDLMHVYRNNRRTGTTSFEAKLLQHMVEIN